MKKLNILRVMGYPFKHYGSLEGYLIQLSRECQKRGHKAFLHFDSDSMPYDEEYVSDAFDAGCEIVGFSIDGKIDISYLTKMIRLIRKKEINVVHSYFSPACHIASFAAWLCGVKGIFRTIGSMPYVDGYIVRAIGVVRQNLAALPIKKIITVCEAIRRECGSFYKMDEEKFEVIYGGVDLEKYSSNLGQKREKIKKEFNITEQDKVVGVIADLEPRKGVEYFLDAIPLILRKIPNIKVFLVGDGSLKNNLQNMSKMLRISNNILFTGTRNDVDAIISVLDVSVLPSLWGEGLSASLLESMAAGKPIVATDIGGTTEIIEDGKNGFVVPPRDSAALAEAILRVLRSEELGQKLGVEGRKIVNSKFDTKLRVKKELELYEQYIQ